MNKQNLKGHVKEVESKIKEVAGKLVGNERVEEKDKAEKIAGKRTGKTSRDSRRQTPN